MPHDHATSRPAPAASDIRVHLGPRSYSVHTGPGALRSLGSLLLARCPGQPRRCIIVRDLGVPDAVLAAAEASLTAAAIRPTVIPFKPSEPAKSLASLQAILESLARARVERHEPVIALGGGITGDLAGFAAATYRRGVPFVQCPTTLLAMVDASVGGKTAVNLDLGSPGAPDLKKNLIGAFHQPILVIADTDTLRSLPARLLRSGLAECIKHAMIAGAHGDEGLFDWTRANLPLLLQGDATALTQLLARNISIKARIVEQDEREEAADELGGRALLNLGHTFGHAIETLGSVSPDGNPANAPLLHGEAVALGLVAATRTAQHMGSISAPSADEAVALIRATGLPTSVRGLPSDDTILALMAHDKKVVDGRLRLILPCDGRRAIVTREAPREAIAAGLAAIRA